MTEAPPPYPPVWQQPGPPRFDIGTAISWSWLKFRENVSTLMLNTLVLLVGGLFMYAFAFLVAKSVVPDGSFFLKVDSTTGNVEGLGDYFALLGVLYLTVFVLAIPFSVLSAGYIHTGLRIADGEKPGFAEMFKVRNPVRIMLAATLVGLASVIGVMLCYLPGIAVALFAGFTIHSLVDKGLAPVDAIKASVTLVKNNFGNAIVVLLIGGLIGGVGFIACFVGILVSAPVAMLIHVYAYRFFSAGPIAN